MGVTEHRPQIIRIQAMQLAYETYKDEQIDNATELAMWCSGQAFWSYDPLTDVKTVTVRINDGKGDTAHATDWVVRQENGTFEVLTDNDFRKRYDSESYAGTPTCSHCLADPRYTPSADPGEKACPQCNCRYSGPARTTEYTALVLAGLVSDVG